MKFHSYPPQFPEIESKGKTTDQSYNLLLPSTPWLTTHTNCGPRVGLTIAVPGAGETCCTHRDWDNGASRSLPRNHSPLKSLRPLMSLALLLLCMLQGILALSDLSSQEKKRKTHHSIDPLETHNAVGISGLITTLPLHKFWPHSYFWVLDRQVP